MEHVLNELDENIIDKNPIKQFQKWFDEAKAAKISLAEAMILATVSHDGKPSARMVLLKNIDERGFEFYSNYNSRKGKELDGNPGAALLFHWTSLERQVRVEGTVKKITAEESEKYFQTRPRESQIGAWASSQSEIVANREELEKRFQEISKQYEGKTVPRPPHWGGFRVQPHTIEFWKGRIGRLHDRILYELQNNGTWTIKRLAP